MAGAAERFVVIVSSNKVVDGLRVPLPLELLAFDVDATLRAVSAAYLTAAPPSTDGGVLAGYFGLLDDPTALTHRLSATPGVVEHGLFLPTIVEILIGQARGVQRRRIGAGKPGG